ncbi:YceD family protein [Enterococcus larvae]|uniref:YceD family protein n=1 Tax=Enterococcus larvae TaxID=2794352 RepID=UPI003F3AC764
MKWSLLELNKHREIPLEFSEELDVKQTLMARDNQILDVSPAKVNGIITVEKNGYLLHYKLSVVVTVPSSRSLTPVAVPMALSVDEMFMTEEQFRGKDELISDEEIIVLDKPTIDLTESVEDNILLAIPLQVLSEEEQQNSELPKGTDWEVISEDDYYEKREKEAEQTMDPRLAKLSELLKDDTE